MLLLGVLIFFVALFHTSLVFASLGVLSEMGFKGLVLSLVPGETRALCNLEVDGCVVFTVKFEDESGLSNDLLLIGEGLIGLSVLGFLILVVGLFFSDGVVELLLLVVGVVLVVVAAAAAAAVVDGFVVLLAVVRGELEDGVFFFSFPTTVLLSLGFVAIYIIRYLS
ncbi:unnamed protein product [Trifolium pratense]|uniref:Uncharacterized protein n=1 Tax=Trifolium pratense TaxID=57577 RepID=A0ACB0M0F1_TRIPR|nr:unnamed protein product [Trifolium pratense]